MKYFLAQYEIRDGEHEHIDYGMFKATSFKQAEKLAEAQAFDNLDVDETDNHYFAYGDGLTACKWKGLAEITKQEANTLNKLGVVYFIN